MDSTVALASLPAQDRTGMCPFGIIEVAAWYSLTGPLCDRVTLDLKRRISDLSVGPDDDRRRRKELRLMETPLLLDVTISHSTCWYLGYVAFDMMP